MLSLECKGMGVKEQHFLLIIHFPDLLFASENA